MRRSFPCGLLVAVFLGSVARGEPVVAQRFAVEVVAPTDADREVLEHLAALVRVPLRRVDVPREESSEVSDAVSPAQGDRRVVEIVLDRHGGRVEAVQWPDGRRLERRLDPATARASSLAVAVAAAELLDALLPDAMRHLAGPSGTSRDGDAGAVSDARVRDEAPGTRGDDARSARRTVAIRLAAFALAPGAVESVHPGIGVQIERELVVTGGMRAAVGGWLGGQAPTRNPVDGDRHGRELTVRSGEVAMGARLGRTAQRTSLAGWLQVGARLHDVRVRGTGAGNERLRWMVCGVLGGEVAMGVTSSFEAVLAAGVSVAPWPVRVRVGGRTALAEPVLQGRVEIGVRFWP
ncbi:MAG: hypothetical protein NZ898_07160 [Myxococcota bacterium]|nr:hypothetical protein [Myxococcota bacterium]MDW8362588.1 hypothetical protein [Myxococcales bacterium]